ncbi:MAG: hypothetical protein OEV74_07530 [Cyclobacteriaceae bacterium]|nr:hypothetical protein [Cyclobacteriaceae bacterium]MDH4296109.1 hypothetical protein [Cyclobacteriaceae bacterium]MDH5248077.1 hypothetical protein [Cyclobacteriaceae bacterium]
MKLLVENRDDGLYLFFWRNNFIKVDEVSQDEIIKAIKSTYNTSVIEPYHYYVIKFDGLVRVKYEYHNLYIKNDKLNEEWIVDTKEQWDKRILTSRKRKLAVLIPSVTSSAQDNYAKLSPQYISK